MNVGAPRERPILFSGPMVKALLSGAKTQTRRIVAEQRGWDPQKMDLRAVAEHPDIERTQAFFGEGWGAPCPYGKRGDRLWVRETWAHRSDYHGARIAICYQADRAALDLDVMNLHPSLAEQTDVDAALPPLPADLAMTWKPSIHMRRAFSRLALEVTGIRVERVQSISDEDARAEGVISWAEADFWPKCQALGVAAPNRPSFLFKLLWLQINGQESWDANPWVWVVEFKRAEAAR